MADHLEELEAVEAETKRNLEQVTGTLDNTVAYFARRRRDRRHGRHDVERGYHRFGAAAFPAESLAVVVGLYLIALCFIITPLSIGLRHGLDRALVGITSVVRSSRR